MRSRRFAISALITASLVAVAGAAQSAPYEVSTKNRYFCCTNPPVFAFGVPQSMAGYHTVAGVVSQTGTGTPAIRIGMGHVARLDSSYIPISVLPGRRDAAAFDVSNGGPKGTIGPDSLWDIYVRNSFSNGSGTLQKSGGNLASFSFCPKAKGPGPGACTDPSKATPAPFFNGRIKVTPGPNKFGGTLQILAGSKGVGGTKFYLYRFLGGANMSQLPAAKVYGHLILAPIGASAAGDHVFGPGPQYIGYPWTDFMMTTFPDAGLSIHGAGKFTTGMVTLHISMFNNPPVRSVMLTGYDDRTPAGLGNIQLVSGLLFNSNYPDSPAPGANVIGWKMRIHVVPEPGASLGLAGGALGLLAIGVLRGKRSR